MTQRTPGWLYLRQNFTAALEADTGLTITAKWCASDEGDPSAIGSLTDTMTEVSGSYTVTFASTDLVSDLAADYVGDRVWLHIADATGAIREVFEYVVTETDPDLLPTRPRPKRVS